jgi:hypothetical protein
MFSRMQQAVMCLAAMLILTFGFASAAQAYTSYTRIELHQGVCKIYEYRNYNWWEEVFQGKVDGKYYVGWAPRYTC